MRVLSFTDESDVMVKEEKINTITHGIGVILGAVALTLLVIKSIYNDDSAQTMISYVVYGISFILLFLASTVYHAATEPKLKKRLKTVDHCAIFLLIAGTYTPFLLIALKTPLANYLMIGIWATACIGIILKLFFIDKLKKSSLAMYLIMGWLSVIVIYQLAGVMSLGGLVLLSVGGAIYTVGTIFYAIKAIPYNHAIWHLFVLGGAICHFFAIYLYVVPVISF
ncbi:hemolysin III family protein [Vibrio sp. SS-MA-C1-2]|uniref:PAQR family membrane homeostasis protein TrhA n=1 Tax=Vibrio sp. SS-MA-C1-2 TaxID=2908646 RepID=UPI001F33F72E|nr:hemolysin III family protein [Vibrio sp. SS-MA-C1-2]UJF19354.1 hemolysin III family protein [Vibrio sp. SS-MA-C1-2]